MWHNTFFNRCGDYPPCHIMPAPSCLVCQGCTGLRYFFPWPSCALWRIVPRLWSIYPSQHWSWFRLFLVATVSIRNMEVSLFSKNRVVCLLKRNGWNGLCILINMIASWWMLKILWVLGSNTLGCCFDLVTVTIKIPPFWNAPYQPSLSTGILCRQRFPNCIIMYHTYIHQTFAHGIRPEQPPPCCTGLTYWLMTISLWLTFGRYAELLPRWSCAWRGGGSHGNNESRICLDCCDWWLYSVSPHDDMCMLLMRYLVLFVQLSFFLLCFYPFGKVEP